MVDDLRRPGTTPRDPRLGPAGPERSAYSSLIQDLQSAARTGTGTAGLARDAGSGQHGVAHRAGDSAATGAGPRDETDRTRGDRRRLQDAGRAQKREWSASLTQLEDDRRLLAEAWERVERERIDVLSASEQNPHRHAQGQGPQTAAPAGLLARGAAVPARSAGGRFGRRIIRSPRRSSDNSKPCAATCGGMPRDAATLVEKEEGQNRETPGPPSRSSSTLRSRPNGRLARPVGTLLPRPGHGPPLARPSDRLALEAGRLASSVGWRSGGRTRRQRRAAANSLRRCPVKRQHRKARSSVRPRSHDEIHGMTKRLIDEDRYAFVLLKEAVDQISDRDARRPGTSCTSRWR